VKRYSHFSHLCRALGMPNADVALMISGEERGFLHANLWRGYSQFVVSPLRNASAEVTCFLCLDRASREGAGLSSRRPYMHMLHVAAVRRFDARDAPHRRAECWASLVVPYERHAARVGRRFSHVLIGRTDAVWYSAIDVATLLSDHAVVLRARRLGQPVQQSLDASRAEHALVLSEDHFSWWGGSACPMRSCKHGLSGVSAHNVSYARGEERQPATWCLLADDQAAVAPRDLVEAYLAAGAAASVRASLGAGLGGGPVAGRQLPRAYGGVRYVAWQEAGCFRPSHSPAAASPGRCTFFGTPSIRAKPGSDEHTRQCTRARWKPAACWREHLLTARLLDSGVPLRLGPLPFYLSARTQLGTSDRTVRVPRATRRVSC
jgi:hypothetical protein